MVEKAIDAYYNIIALNTCRHSIVVIQSNGNAQRSVQFWVPAPYDTKDLP